MDAAGGRGDDGSAEVWRRRLHRYLAGVMELDASVAADYHELQVGECFLFSFGRIPSLGV